MKKQFIVLLSVAFITAGCQQTAGPKQTGGTLLGAIGGAIVGAQVGNGTGQLAGVAVGTLLGAYVGSEIGSSLDKADKLYANQTAQSAFERNATGNTSVWRNPDSGHSGTVTPTSDTYKTANNQYCREYEQTVLIEGKKEKAYGTTCRNQNGEWIIQ